MRKYNYHVITPLTRFGNITKLMRMLSPQQVSWHVIVDEDILWRPQFPASWIRCYSCPNSGNEFWNRCNSAINWFLDRALVHFPSWASDRWCFLNDDDAYEPDFFSKIDARDGELIICSMERGHQTPPGVDPERAHGTGTLVATPELMHPGQVGVEQIILSGRLAQAARLPLHICGDGLMIEWIVQNHPATYAPEARVWFNYYEPGRWNKP